MSQKIHFMFQRVFMPVVRYGVERLKLSLKKEFQMRKGINEAVDE